MVFGKVLMHIDMIYPCVRPVDCLLCEDHILHITACVVTVVGCGFTGRAPNCFIYH